MASLPLDPWAEMLPADKTEFRLRSSPNVRNMRQSLLSSVLTQPVLLEASHIFMLSWLSFEQIYMEKKYNQKLIFILTFFEALYEFYHQVIL